MKQSTSFAQVVTNLLNVLQGYSKTIRLLLVMFLTLTVSANAWGADVVYKTAKFGSSYNSAKVSSYTSSWYSTYNGFRVDIVNANNNQNGWSYIKMGSKNAASIGTITTNVKIDAAITKVSLKIDAITKNNITSITLKTATSSNGTYTSVGTFTKAIGTQTVTLASPTANLFYKIEVVCTKGSDNGLIQISQIDYYKSDVVATPEYNITYTGDEHITYSGTKPETITKEDGGFELEFSVNDGYQLDDVQVKMGGQNLVVEDDYYWEEGYLLILPETDITGDIEIIFETVATCTNPTITTQPSAATYTKGATATALKVVASGDDLTYQWYSNTSNSTSGATKINGATNSTYTPSTSTVGTKYYYCIVSSGSCSTTSNIVSVVVKNPPFTVTLVPGSGSVTSTTLTETSAGTGVELPEPTLDCGDWEFAGWKTTSAVNAETTTKPTLIPAGNYKPTANTTLYAVYQRTKTTSGGGGSGDYELVTSAPDDWSGTYLIVDGTSKNCFNGSLTALDAGGNYTSVTISDKTITSNTTTDRYSVTISKSTTNGKYYIKTYSGYYIGSNAEDASKGNELDASTSTKYDNSISISSNNVTIQGPDHILKFFYQSGQSWRFRYYKSTTTSNVRLPQLYKKSSGTTTTTYYHSTPECGTPCTDAVNVKKGTPSNGSFTMVSGYQSTCNGPVTVTLSNIQPATGYQFSAITQSGINTGVTIDDAAKTVTYAKNTTGTSTINVTFTPAVYTINYKDQGDVAFSGTHEDGYPQKHTYNTATTLKSASKDHYTFDGWYKESNCSGTKVTTLGATEYTDNITLYAKWTANTYTITLDAGTGECGTESFTTTNASGVTLPTASHTCTDWSFAGWWTEEVSSTNTSPGTLMKAGDTYKPTSNITLYAVYSTEEAGDAFTGYAKVTTAPDDWSGKYLLSTGTYTATGNFDSDATSGHLVRTTYTPNTEEKTEWEFTLEKVDNTKYSILFPDGNWYLGWKESTSFERSPTDPSQNAAYLWTPSTSGITNVYATTRKIADNGSADFRPYSSPSSSNIVYLYKRVGGGSTTIYNSNPSCEVCENIITINKGAETNGTFTLSKSGEIETCVGDVVVTVSEISPAEHYSVSAVTATPPTSGGAPNVTNNDDGTWTVTYNQNSTGESTINVTFVQDEKASITLSELGVTTTDNTTYYVGETYTLPSTSSQSCDGKQLVGWSTVEVAETDIKPTEKYYELDAEVTLAATQTFYAVFATANGEGDSGSGYRYIGDETLLTIGKKYIFVSTNTAGNAFALKASDLAYTGTGTKGTAVAVTVTSVSEEMLVATENTDLEFEAVELGEDYTLRVVSDDTEYLYINGSGIGYRDVSRSYYDETGLYGWNNDGNKWYDVYYDASSQKFIQKEYATSRVYAYEKQATTTYTAYTTSCVPTYSITYDFAGGTGSHCSNSSIPQGDTYTICDEEPTKEGNKFLHWSDGTSTYAAGETITPSSDVTLTAIWQINTYTVIWSNNGATTPVDYNHGDALEVPAAPASCDGVKEFVGWTEDNTFTYHATTPPSDIFTEKTATVTADATYYAVFATPPGTGGGGGGSETTTTLDFTAQGYADATAISNLTVNGVTATFAKGSNGSNAPKYYTNGTAIRAYGGNTITLSSTGTITSVTFTFSTGDDENEITANNGDGEWNEPDWTGNTTNDIVFTIGGTSGHRRIKSIAVTYTSGGGSGSYSDYTTTCQPVESIEVQNPQTEFYLTDNFTIGEGKVIATLSGGGTADVTALATFSGYNMEVVGTYTVTVTYMGATATYNINVKPLDNAWVLTWNVSGKTNTGLGPRYVTKGTAIGTLPTPVVPDACEGKTFMGWTTSNIVNSDGSGITYINEGTVPNANTTYYAVFATVNNFSVQKPINDITDGSKVVIVAVASLDNTGSTGKAISSRTISITSKGVIGLAGDDVSIFDETINTPHSTCIWTLRKNGETVTFEQGDKYIKATDSGYRKLVLDATADYWTLIPVAGKDKTYHMKSGNTNHFVEWFDHTDSKYDEGERYIGFVPYTEANDKGNFDMQFYVTANADGNADITDYTTGCTEYTITYYGFRGGYSTSTSSDGIIVLPVNSLHTVPNCGDVVTDHTNLGREFLNVWMTQPHGGHTFKPGDTFILTQDTTLYAQWKMETTNDVTTLPTDIEDLAGTDVYVYGGKTLNIQPGTTTINSLTLKGGLQSDGSYKMPIVWVPEGATLVRNSNKIYLDLKVNAKNYYPFAVPFATKNDQYIDYLDPVLNAASTYDKHFVIKTYNGALRATNGEDRANNWVKVKRHQSAEEPSYLQPGVGYIIQALTYPDRDTTTIRIPMTVPNTWFENGEQAAVGTTVRNTIAVTAHAGAAATEHQRHAGWNFVASPYLTNFAGGNVENNGGLEYINGELTVNGGWQYGGEEVPYVTIPAYDFSYYTQHKLSDVKLSPEWSFFVQIGKDGTMDFSTAGRQETPASIAARHDAAQSFKMDVDIVLSDKHHSDQMGLIICDRFSSAYEIGYDLEKMFGSAYNLTVYTLMEDNTPLAYQALAIHSNMQVIPVGYRVPEQGDYTFALNQSTSSIDLLNEQYEQLILVDYETGALTNLLNSTYTFTSPRTQSDSRFAIYAVIRQKTPTDLPNIDDGDTSTRKILHNGHLYILRDGKVYNGNGQIVK